MPIRTSSNNAPINAQIWWTSHAPHRPRLTLYVEGTRYILTPEEARGIAAQLTSATEGMEAYNRNPDNYTPPAKLKAEDQDPKAEAPHHA